MTNAQDQTVPHFTPVSVSPSEMPSLLAQMTAHVVGIHLASSPTSREEIPALFRMVHQELASIAGGQAVSVSKRADLPEEATVEGQIDPERWPGVFPDRIVCLEDGRAVTLLKSYVRRRFDITIAEYLRRWKLPSDYPMVPSQYADRKRTIARRSGLGTSVRANKERKIARAA